MSPIVVVDVDDYIRDVVCDMLGIEGFVTQPFGGGGDLLAALSSGLRPGLIFIDLPGTESAELLSELRQDPALVSLPVATTAPGTFAGSPRVHLVAKPIDFEELLQIVREYCIPTPSGPLSF